jgi:hypothetical protein
LLLQFKAPVERLVVIPCGNPDPGDAILRACFPIELAAKDTLLRRQVHHSSARYAGRRHMATLSNPFRRRETRPPDESETAGFKLKSAQRPGSSVDRATPS